MISQKNVKELKEIAVVQIYKTYGRWRTLSARNSNSSYSFQQDLNGGPGSPLFVSVTFLCSFTNLSRIFFHFFCASSTVMLTYNHEKDSCKTLSIHTLSVVNKQTNLSRNFFPGVFSCILVLIARFLVLPQARIAAHFFN